MYFNTLRLSTLFSFIFISSFTQIFAQEDSLFLHQAKIHYEEGNFRNALYYLNKNIESDEKSALAYKMRGDCYLEFNHLNNAIKDYRSAIAIDPRIFGAYYNLGIVYEEKAMEDSAMWYYKKYDEINPADADCLLKIAALFASSTQVGEKSDSVTLYLKKAYNADQENADAVYYLAYDYMTMDQLDSALLLAEYGAEAFPDDVNFLGLSGIIYLKKKQYGAAIESFNKSLEKDSTALEYQLYRHTTNMLQNTIQEMFGMNNLMIPRFQEIHSKNLKKMDEWVEEEEHYYHYDSLKGKFLKGEEVLGLDEYFMLYYGYAQQDSYSPYALDDRLMEQLFAEEAYDQCYKEAGDVIFCNPSNLKAHYYRAASAFHLGKNKEYVNSLLHFHGFISSIMATGDGLGFESAFIVIYPKDEYEVIEYQGLEFISQTLRNHQSQSFDVFSVEDESGTEQEVFFNISVPFDSLNKMFKKSGKRRKKRK